jgi:hypothetical protein
VELPPYGTRLLQARATVSEDAARELADGAESSAVAIASAGAETPLASALRHRMAARLREGSWHKAAACAQQLRRQLGMRGTVEARDVIRLRATVVTPDGVPATGARVRARLSPIEWRCWDLAQVGRGEYELALERDSLPPRYERAAGSYRPYWGTVRVFLQARREGGEGETAIDFVLARE